MAARGWRLLVVGLAFALAFGGPLRLISSAVPSVQAEDTTLAAPFLNDGAWTGTLNAAGPFDIKDFHGVVDYSGTFEFTVATGMIAAGTWTMQGAGGASHPRVTGTVTYEAAGSMGGTADRPQMVPDTLTASYDLVVDGVRVSGTTEFARNELSTIFVPLVSATCDFAVGDWEVPANMAYRSVGRSAIVGYWFAARAEGAAAGGEDARTLVTAIRALLTRAVHMIEDATDRESFDIDAFNQLISDSEFLDQRLVLTSQCGGRTLPGWVNPVGPMMVITLGWAIGNPDLFDNAELLRLVVAGVRTNALGSNASTDARTRGLDTLVAMELSRRADHAREEGDCLGATQVYAAARALADPEVATVVEGDMTEACQ